MDFCLPYSLFLFCLFQIINGFLRCFNRHRFVSSFTMRLTSCTASGQKFRNIWFIFKTLPIPTRRLKLSRNATNRLSMSLVLLVSISVPAQTVCQMRHNLSLWRTLTHTLNRLHIKIIAVCSVNEPGVVGINIGTRPDCLPDDVIDYLAELTERIGHQVEEVEFNPLNVIVRHTTANILHHHLVGFPWQPINQMRHNLSLWRTLTHTLTVST